jgi:hypothetical protein
MSAGLFACVGATFAGQIPLQFYIGGIHENIQVNQNFFKIMGKYLAPYINFLVRFVVTCDINRR